MESKKIRVIDEHSMDRVANIICAFDVDGSEYITYWIDRDAENDNIFVSKLLKNLDGTSNMVNIEDEMEKAKMSDIVKELIKYSIDNESDKLPNQAITLPSGKNVLVVPVLINKDQNINVQKTYITTVKKSVTKVSDQYYEIKVEEKENAPVVTPVVPTEVKPEPEVVPVVEPTPAPVVEPVPVAPAPVVSTPEVVPTPVVAPTPAAVPEPVLPVVSEVETPKVETPVVTTVVPEAVPVAPVAPTPEVAPTPVVAPTPAVVPEPVLPVIPEVETPKVETPVVTTVVPEAVPAAPVAPAPEVAPTPVVAPTPIVVPPVPEPATVAPEAPVENKLVFDASKETNLNQALGEVSNEATIPVENIEPVREFGQDTPTVNNPVPEVAPTEISQVGPTLKKKMGFANSKFFMVVAIAFFLASCIFLGYEVFNYFQLKG